MAEAITWALREMNKHPEDSIQDIWNDAFKEWKIPYHATNRLIIIGGAEWRGF
jgi:hypothetical protein